MGESVSITSGEAPSKFEVGTELYVKVDDLNYNDKYVVDTQNKVAEHSTVKRVTKGSVVFPKRGAAIMTNKVRIMGIDGYMDTNMMALTSEKLDSEFLYNIISKEGLYKIADTSTIPQINNKHVEPYEVTIPSLDEQRKIGAYFKQLDHLITLHQRKGDETKKLKKFMLQKMFPKKDAKKPEIRFAGFTDDWEQRKLGEIITEYKETVDSDCTLPILTSSKTEGVILQEEHFGRKQQHDITGYNILPRNYCTYRNRSDGVDFTFNINICCDKGIISKFYPVFSGKNSDVFFLSLVLNNSEEVVHEIAYTCTGTGQKVLSFLDLQKMKVRVPNFDEQKEIAAYFESLDHLITLHRRAYYNKKGGLTNVHNDNQQHYAIL